MKTGRLLCVWSLAAGVMTWRGQASAQVQSGCGADGYRVIASRWDVVLRQRLGVARGLHASGVAGSPGCRGDARFLSRWGCEPACFGGSGDSATTGSCGRFRKDLGAGCDGPH